MSMMSVKVSSLIQEFPSVVINRDMVGDSGDSGRQKYRHKVLGHFRGISQNGSFAWSETLTR